MQCWRGEGGGFGVDATSSPFPCGPIQPTSNWTKSSWPPPSYSTSSPFLKRRFPQLQAQLQGRFPYWLQHTGQLSGPPLLCIVGRGPKLGQPWFSSFGGGLGGVLYSARRGLRTTEARENWKEEEERKGKKTRGRSFKPFPILL